jgi:hypothetical protein
MENSYIDKLTMMSNANVTEVYRQARARLDKLESQVGYIGYSYSKWLIAQSKTLTLFRDAELVMRERGLLCKAAE